MSNRPFKPLRVSIRDGDFRQDGTPMLPAVADLRTEFEQIVTTTERLARRLKLDIAVGPDGAFSHYADRQTDLVWVGFAIGRRQATRLAAAIDKLRVGQLERVMLDHVSPDPDITREK